MIKNIIIILLIVLVIYLYYRQTQSKFPSIQPDNQETKTLTEENNPSSSSRTQNPSENQSEVLANYFSELLALQKSPQGYNMEKARKIRKEYTRKIKDKQKDEK